MAGAALAWLGRHGSRVIAFGVLVRLPLLIPIIGPCLLALLCLDWRQLGG